MWGYIEQRTEDSGGCRLWTGFINEYGYAQIKSKKNRDKFVVRWLLEQRLGRALSKDEVTHHTCDNKSCINLDHIRTLSRSEHTKLHKPDGPSANIWGITVKQRESPAEWHRQYRKKRREAGNPVYKRVDDC